MTTILREAWTGGGPIGASPEFVVLILLILLLITKEVSSTAPRSDIRYVSTAVDVAVLPLAMAFLVFAAFRLLS